MSTTQNQMPWKLASWAFGGVLFFTLLAIFYDHFVRQPSPKNISCDLAKDSIDKMKEWGIWMAAIQTGAIAALGALSKGGLCRGQRTSGTLSLVFFGSSILAASWLLSSLPSLLLRLDHDSLSALNDIYEKPIYSFIPVRVGVVAVLEHTYFLLGVGAFAFFVLQEFDGNGTRKNKTHDASA